LDAGASSRGDLKAPPSSGPFALLILPPSSANICLDLCRNHCVLSRSLFRVPCFKIRYQVRRRCPRSKFFVVVKLATVSPRVTTAKRGDSEPPPWARRRSCFCARPNDTEEASASDTAGGAASSIIGPNYARTIGLENWLRSRHSGLVDSINLIFCLRVMLLISFSRAIAWLMSLNSSKCTKRLTLYRAVNERACLPCARRRGVRGHW
jgi:hypothetical protein